MLKPKKTTRQATTPLTFGEEEFSPLERVSLAQRVKGMIRHAIVTGVLMPGEFISPQQIGDRLGVSRTPIREALIHLNAIGLVEFLPNRVRIASPTPSAIVDAFELREALEGMASRLAAERRTEAQAKAINDLAERTQQKYKDRKRFQEDDRKFHLMIGASSGSPSIDRYLSNALDLAFTLRNLRVAERAFRPLAAGIHLEIAQAIKDQDPDLAEEKSREHVRRVRDFIKSEADDPENGESASGSAEA